MLVIQFEDSGPGISDDILPFIFDPFTTSKHDGEGAGLGLAICCQIMEGMAGKISAETGREGGAKFIIEFQLFT